MSIEKGKSSRARMAVAASPNPEPLVTEAPPHRPALFRRLDWMVFGVTTFLIMVAYLITLAPDLTLEDSGELAVASYYAGVPHPPGYPIWTIYTWLFTELIPFSNIAWRVALSSAVAGAFACGLLALLVSRGSSLLLEGIAEFKGLDRRLESRICLVSGFVAGMLLGFNGFMWSQAVIVEVYTLSVLSFMGVLCCLLRWIYAPEQRRYLYLTFFLFGICFTNHQTLIVAAMGLQVAILAAHRKIGRDLLLGNSIIYIAGLGLKSAGLLTSFDNNLPLFVIYNLIGAGSVAAFGWATWTTRTKASDWVAFGRDLLLAVGVGYILALVAIEGQVIVPDTKAFSFKFLHLAGIASLAGCAWITYGSLKRNRQPVPLALKILLGYALLYGVILFTTSSRYVTWFNASVPVFLIHHLLGLGAAAGLIALLARGTGLGSEIKVLTMSGVMWLAGASFYFYMPVASMTNPPMNWGYARTVEGFWHVLTRGQYDKTNPTTDPGVFVDQALMYFEGAVNEFSLVVLLIGLVPFFFLYRMQKRERAWLVGLTGIYLCLAVLLMILLNPKVDQSSANQARVFFTASHIVVAIAIGYGITLIAGLMSTRFETIRMPLLWGGAAAMGIELYYVFDTFWATQFPLLRIASLVGLALATVYTVTILINYVRAPVLAVLIIFAFVPARSAIANWADNEQRGHLFGYWFGHDMFSPPFEVYPEMSRDAILFGGTDPGRFNPTYMIFAESFLEPEKRRDPEFDRRDVYIITQNALADGTYLSYIRAHYNRSEQSDPYFFSEFVRTGREREQRRTNLFARALLPVDRVFTNLGARIEKERQVGGSYFQADHFTDLEGFAVKLRRCEDAVSQFLFDHLSEETRRKLDQETSPKRLGRALAGDLNQILKGDSIYAPARFEGVALSPRTRRLIEQIRPEFMRIRLNRLLIEEAYPREIARSEAGVYPDLEIRTPSVRESKDAFEEYLIDAQRRMALDQLRPGEDVRIVDGMVHVAGQMAVMAINGILTRKIFDSNPDHEFYLEESFPLEWMFPHLTPFGIIMKINREPVEEMTEEILRKDHEFWRQYSERLIGDWITYDTTIEEICEFAERVFLRRDYRGFEGDPRFVRDDVAQKAFSKLRSAIGGLYSWHLINPAKPEEERDRLFREAEFALGQAFAFCPESPEAVYKLVSLLASAGRFSEAELVVQTSRRFDPQNAALADLARQLEYIRRHQLTAEDLLSEVRPAETPGLAPAAEDLPSLMERIGPALQAGQGELAGRLIDQAGAHPAADAKTYLTLAQHTAQLGDRQRLLQILENLRRQIPVVQARREADPANIELAFELFSVYLLTQETNLAVQLLDELVAAPDADVVTLRSAAEAYAQLQNLPKLEWTLEKLVARLPSSAEAWYDLAAARAVQGKTNAAIQSLATALNLSRARGSGELGAPDLKEIAASDSRFQPFRHLPEFKQAMNQ